VLTVVSGAAPAKGDLVDQGNESVVGDGDRDGCSGLDSAKHVPDLPGPPRTSEGGLV
jgi:hypothetical protein